MCESCCPHQPWPHPHRNRVPTRLLSANPPGTELESIRAVGGAYTFGTERHKEAHLSGWGSPSGQRVSLRARVEGLQKDAGPMHKIVGGGVNAMSPIQVVERPLKNR